MKLSSFQAFRSTFISIISYFISYNSYFLSHDMTGYHGQKYQNFKKLLKCSVVLGMYIGIFEKVKGILRFTSSYIGTIPMKPLLTAIDCAPELMLTLSKWSLRVCYHFHKAKSSIQILQLLQQWFFGPEQQKVLSALQVQRGTAVLVLWWWNKQMSTNWARITFTTLHAEEQQWLSDLWVGWAWDGRSSR